MVYYDGICCLLYLLRGHRCKYKLLDLNNKRCLFDTTALIIASMLYKIIHMLNVSCELSTYDIDYIYY